MNKFAISTLIMCVYSYAAVNDIMPSDYEAPLANSTVISLNYLTKELRTNNLPNNQYIKQNTYALRYCYAIDVDGKILSLAVAIPYSNLKTNGNTLSSFIGEKSSGLSDSIFSSTYWFISDRKNKEFLALTMTLSTPNGEYKDSQLLNAGEDRYKTTFNIGYITKISEDFIFEISPEIAFYGNNKTENDKIEQKSSYAINSNLRYKPNKKYSLGAAYYTDKFHQIMLRFAQEADKEYGFKTEKEMLLRYRFWF